MPWLSVYAILWVYSCTYLAKPHDSRESTWQITAVNLLKRCYDYKWLLGSRLGVWALDGQLFGHYNLLLYLPAEEKIGPQLQGGGEPRKRLRSRDKCSFDCSACAHFITQTKLHTTKVGPAIKKTGEHHRRWQFCSCETEVSIISAAWSSIIHSLWEHKTARRQNYSMIITQQRCSCTSCKSNAALQLVITWVRGKECAINGQWTPAGNDEGNRF